MEQQTTGREERHANQALGNEIPGTREDLDWDAISCQFIRGGLADLDWEVITCQSRKGCTNEATHIVHLHAVDCCNHPDLDSSGNVIDILCVGCLADVAHQAHRQAVQFDRYLDPHCLTCGAPVTKMTDIVRAVTML
jgi:hypothetical protein